MAESNGKYIQFPVNRKIPENKDVPEHYALLINDEKGELPAMFSICGSMSLEYLRGFPTFFAVLGNDFTRWITVNPDLHCLEDKESEFNHG